MKFAQKKVLAIAAGLACIGFTTISVCTATVAWFSQNREVRATGMKVRAKKPGETIDLTYDVLRWNDTYKVGESYGEDPAEIKLPPFDHVISLDNPYANVILRLDATFPQGNHLLPSEYFGLEFTCTADLFNASNLVNGEISNLVNFKAVAYAKKDAGEGQSLVSIGSGINDRTTEYENPETSPTLQAEISDGRYQSSTSYFHGIHESVVYVAPALNNASKVSPKKVTVIPDLPNRTNEISQLIVYLEIAYNPTLAYFYKTHQDSDFALDATHSYLSDDITEMGYGKYTSLPSDGVSLYPDELEITAGAVPSGNNITVSGLLPADPAPTLKWYAAEQGSEQGIGHVDILESSNTGAKVKGTKAGKAVVSATSNQASAYVDVTILRAVTAKVYLDPKTLEGLQGETAQITASCYDFDGNLTYNWSSNQESVVTVASGHEGSTPDSTDTATVNYVGGGNATITCTVTDEHGNTQDATCTVTVRHPTITINQGDTYNGVAGTTVTLTTSVSAFSATPAYNWSIVSGDIVVSFQATPNTAMANVTVKLNTAGSATVKVVATHGTLGQPGYESAEDSITITVTSFTISPTFLVGVAGADETATLTVSASGYEGRTLTYVWSSSEDDKANDAKFIEILGEDTECVVEYQKPGQATVTCTLKEGDTVLATATCNVTFGQLTLNPTSLYRLWDHENETITASLAGITGATYTWTSSTPATASVTNTNAITQTIDYLNAGSTTITCTATYQSVTFTATCTVNVAKAGIDQTELTATEGDPAGTINITATGFTGTVSYSADSSNTAVATVSVAGSVVTVTYVAAGTATITCRITDGTLTKELTCSVTVNASGGSGTTSAYVKVTQALTDWSGTYLIVYTDKAFDGSRDGSTSPKLDEANNYKTVTISNNEIAQSDEIDTYTFTIETVSGGYAVKSHSGWYIGNDANSNKLNANKTTKYVNTITFVSENQINITGKARAQLVFNTASGQTRFRYMKTATAPNMGQISLFKLNS